MDIDKLSSKLDELKKLSPEEICWLIRNITYHLVSYYNDSDKGPIYDGSYDQMQIEQATRMQQTIRNNVDIFGQIFDHRFFEDDYLEDLLTNNYYSKYKDAEQKAEEYKEKANMYDDLCD